MKYSYCESENPSFGDSMQFLIETPKWLDSIDFSTLFSQVLIWKKNRSMDATLRGKIFSKMSHL